MLACQTGYIADGLIAGPKLPFEANIAIFAEIAALAAAAVAIIPKLQPEPQVLSTTADGAPEEKVAGIGGR